jgi:hypothetical protein
MGGLVYCFNFITQTPIMSARRTKMANATETKEKKAQEVKDALAKSKKQKKDKKPKETMDGITEELLKKPGGVTKAEIVNVLVKKYPKKDKDTIADTTRRRLNGYLQRKRGLDIAKDDDGKYSIVTGKKKKTA